MNPRKIKTDQQNRQTLKFGNQQNPPLPKKDTVDSLGNEYYRVFLRKPDSSTVLFIKHVTKNEARVILNRLTTICNMLGCKIEGDFIIIK